MMKAKASSYLVSPLLQKTFIGLGAGAYIAQLCTLLPIFFHTYAEGFRFSQFTVVVLDAVFLPLVLFALAYLMLSKKGSLTGSVFMSTFFATLGLILQVIIAQLFQNLYEVIWELRGFFPQDYSLWQLVPSLLVLLFYALLLVRHKASTSESGRVSLPLQRTYSVLVGSALALNIGLTLYRIGQQYTSNPNLSGFVVMSLQSIFLPIVLFLIAYFLGDRKLSRMSRIFEGVVLVTAGMLLFTIMNAISRYYAPYFLGEYGQFGSWVGYEFAIVALTAVIYTLGLLCIRRK